jgi:hypothetical protein
MAMNNNESNGPLDYSESSDEVYMEEDPDEVQILNAKEIAEEDWPVSDVKGNFEEWLAKTVRAVIDDRKLLDNNNNKYDVSNEPSKYSRWWLSITTILYTYFQIAYTWVKQLNRKEIVLYSILLIVCCHFVYVNIVYFGLFDDDDDDSLKDLWNQVKRTRYSDDLNYDSFKRFVKESDGVYNKLLRMFT